MRFVETPVFTRAITSAIADEHYRRLQIALMFHPEQDNGDLTAAQARTLGRLVREAFT